jgi:transcriptional regulator with XRE-family HTH domain
MSSTTLPRLSRVNTPAEPEPTPAAGPAAGEAAAPAAPARHTRAPTGADIAVGQRIRTLRRAAGYTQKQLADQVGITNAQLHRYEAGASRVAASRLVAIAKALDCRVEDLVSDGMSAPAQDTEEFATLARAFAAISDPKHRAALVSLANTMAGAAFNLAGKG